MITADTSALVAVATREAGFEPLRGVLLDAVVGIGAPTLVETFMVLHGSRGTDDSLANQFCDWLLARSSITVVPFDQALVRWAQIAFDRYGKGRGSGIALNFGDCLSYAVARHLDAPLLFKGTEFGRTDVRVHPASDTMTVA